MLDTAEELRNVPIGPGKLYKLPEKIGGVLNGPAEKEGTFTEGNGSGRWAGPCNGRVWREHGWGRRRRRREKFNRGGGISSPTARAQKRGGAGLLLQYGDEPMAIGGMRKPFMTAQHD